ncbi:MAG: LytR family transcriptional regulator [Dehalococcoidia bacterium]|nr:MAG: LytR family transcriptional regulator [Dehalococcoidia bacterium]
MKRSTRSTRRISPPRPPRRTPRRWRDLFRVTAVGLVALGGLALGLVLFQGAGGAASNLARAAGIANPLGNDLPIWTGNDRVNILLIGVDRREEETADYVRADTMMLVSLDPKARSIGLLSLPRDLWVTIPISERRSVEDRINTVFVYAKTYDVSGGGPELAKRTVEQVIGAKVHYAAWVDFHGFVRVVDSLGGLLVDVRAPLKDNQFPTYDYRTQRIYFAPGLQRMDGERALMYARSRHQDSDLARASRQQEIILAARQRALQLDLVPKLPRLLADFHDIVHTDMSTVEILGLARLAKDVDTPNITIRTVPATPVARGGADVLQIDKRALAKVVAEVLGESAPAPEAASIEVLNGTTTTGLATRTAALLQEKGLAVTRFDTADEARAETAIYAATGKRRTAEIVAGLIGVPTDRIREAPAPPGAADIRVILGRDAKDPQR